MHQTADRGHGILARRALQGSMPPGSNPWHVCWRWPLSGNARACAWCPIAHFERRDDFRQALIAAATKVSASSRSNSASPPVSSRSAARSTAGAASCLSGSGLRPRSPAPARWVCPRCASMPAATHCSRSSLMTLAVSAMMGSRLRAAGRSRLADAPCRRESVHDRHLAVHQHRIEGGRGDALQGFGAVVGDGHLGRELLQHALRHALIHRVVLHQAGSCCRGKWAVLGATGLTAGACGVLPVRTCSTERQSQRRANGLQAHGIRTVRAIARVVFGAEQGQQDEAAGLA